MSETDQASHGMPSPTSKRRRRSPVHDLLDDTEEQTPRPKRTANHFDMHSLSSQSRSQSQSHSQTSGASSPRKRLATMELGPEGIEVRPLTEANRALPDSLMELIADMEQIKSGISVISSSLRDAITLQPRIRLREINFAEPATRDPLGPTPAVDTVREIVSAATYSEASLQTEHGWNCAVHYPLIQLALGIRRRDEAPLVDFTSCTSAKIIKEYLPGQTSSKMVDFCILLSPHNIAQSDSQVPPNTPTPATFSRAAAAQAANAIDALRASLPCQSINHSDFGPLRRDPVAVSVETKRAGAGGEEARLQVGTWHAAQWKLLAGLVGDAGGDLAALPFLPAVIVTGHDWAFACTTREGRRTILWADCPFGSTRSVLGVYSIIYGIQYLARWSREIYLPWYLKNVLGLSSREEG
ncbi:hypothetical protein QBC33DRAFT_564290 [Phialemonium atrogriseum]|uniref:PD-(D/E)XK nuclease-like domain-containing protein n=1 Tax=Phialemonium atrogriseum TaxID=1093897 RepID=A0AAJ0FAY8_9PEZI|nr:uncharacterized protein QBC33DRAFT_564290 [Phialemonium atrogriseum]KAK1761906.1 hypothetical protein QBC33DRAFT_564290 [Phialemonium atrogriseum]